MLSAQRNESNCASIGGDVVGKGAFRIVTKGTYTSGQRAGEHCVAKEFKKGGVYEETYFADDIRAVGEAITIVDAFNRYVKQKVAQKFFFAQTRVMVNKTEVWTYVVSAGKHLLEPFIENFEKFNSNSGAMSSKHNLMHALSHFSYHHTDRERMLCDLQGGKEGVTYILTDPVILSRKKEFGITDLGQTGIENFFHYHTCNEWCDPSWKKILNAKRYFTPSWNSTMVLQDVFSRLTITPQKSAALPAFTEEEEEEEEEDKENYDYFRNVTMLNPACIRYCQDSIKSRFQDGKPIVSTKMELERDGEACVRRIPYIRVYKENGLWFTEDNRRLWCFKNAANIHRVPVTTVSGVSFPSKKTTMNNGVSIRVRN